MSKATERPPFWHEKNVRKEKQKLVDCYVVMWADSKEPHDEYNKYFPCTPQGYREALKFIQGRRPFCDQTPHKTQQRRGALPW